MSGTRLRKRQRRTLEQRLVAYSAVAGAVLGATPPGDAASCNGGVINGTICYQDIADKTLPTDGSTVGIDFDGDGNLEFEIVSSNLTSSSTRGVALELRSNLGDKGSAWRNGYSSTDRGPNGAGVAALHASDPISSAAAFGTAPAPSLAAAFSPSSSSFNFPGKGQRFIGVRIQLDGATTHYGWIRVNVPTGVHSATVYDFAYQMTPDDPILASAVPVKLQNFSVE